MKILITGGTGFVGTKLTSRPMQDGNEVTVLTRFRREPKMGSPWISYLEGDPTQTGPWQEAIKNHNAVINLAGASSAFFYARSWIYGEIGFGRIRVRHPRRTEGDSETPLGQWLYLSISGHR